MPKTTQPKRFVARPVSRAFASPPPPPPQPPKKFVSRSADPSWASAARDLVPLIAAAAAQRPKSKEEKKKKKKDSAHKGISYLKGAAKIAAGIAPTVLPLLLAGHAPTNLSAKAAGVPGVPDLASAGTVGVASAASVAKFATGTGVPSYKTNGSNVLSVVWPGCEEIRTITDPPSGAIWRTGDVMAKISLNPASPDWSGTQVQVQARLWTRYKLKKISVMFQPAVATTTAGQMIGFISTDPDQPFSFTGDTAIKAGLVHQGSDIFNTWSVGCITIAADHNTGDFYTQGDGSDPRLTSPGDFYLLCSADIDMTSLDSIGTIIVAYEFEFSVKSDLDTSYAPGAGCNAKWTTATTQANQALWSYFGQGVGTTMPVRSGTLATLTPYSQLVTGDYGFTIPAGTYEVAFFMSQAGTGTNANSQLLFKTDMVFDNKSRYIKAIDGSFASTVGLSQVLSATGGSILGTVRHGTGVQYVAGHFIISCPKPFILVMQYLNGTQTGVWTNTLSTITITNIYPDLFAAPVVPPMTAMHKEIEEVRETNAELLRKLDFLASLITAPPTSPSVDPASTVERLFALYDAHAPKPATFTCGGPS